MNKITIIILLSVIMNIDSGYCYFGKLTIQKDILHVGIIKSDLFPFVYFNSQNKANGYEVDTIRDFKKELGLKKIYIIPFKDEASLLKGLINGEVDCIASKLRENSQDALSVIYSNAYITLNAVFFINRKLKAQNHHQTETPNNFSKNVTIGILTEDRFFNKQLHRAYPRNTIVTAPNFKRLISWLIRGQIEACAIDEATAKHYFREHPDKALYLAYIAWPKWHEDVAIAFPWNNRHLRDLVNIYLQTHGHSDMTLDDLIRMYSD